MSHFKTVLSLQVIKRVVLNNRSVLVTTCGSAYKNIAVQPLMDSIVNYLPAPKDINHRFLRHYTATDFCAMAFKIVHHPQKGVLTFIRIYSGTLKEGDTIYNVNLSRSEKVSRAQCYKTFYVCNL
jgi:elongation factor G